MIEERYRATLDLMRFAWWIAPWSCASFVMQLSARRHRT